MQLFTSNEFKDNAKAALQNPILQQALNNIRHGFVEKRAQAIAKMPHYDEVRNQAIQIKNHTLKYLDFYLQEFETQVVASGGHVHWAENANDACQEVIGIANRIKAKLITKSKSMVTEEIGLNAALEQSGFDVVETDLGEYIIQLRNESPSHIVAPAIHLLKEQITKTFYEAHTSLNPNRKLDNIEQLLNEARFILRDLFTKADIGITGANCLIAENGTCVMVTNEGNGDLTQTLARVHIVIASIEKIVPTYRDAFSILRLLPRSATGQDITSYVSFSKGPKREHDLDGPEEFHVILIDDGRSKLIDSEFQDILRCIRCGACLNHCPVYQAVGGQAYGTPYPGPMGAVISPSLFGLEKTKDLPNASTFCGRCEEVCPMKIHLPTMMRYYRNQEFKKKLTPRWHRGIKLWAYFAKRPKLYHWWASKLINILGRFGEKKGRFSYLPFASEWTNFRDFPAPAKKTFQQQLKKGKTRDQQSA